MVKRVQNEKRRYTRIIFNERSRVQAVVVLPGQEEPGREMPASVLNMSEGGMQISIERKKDQEIQQGDAVLLSRLTGISELEELKGLSMQAIWIMDNEYLEHVLLGVSFIALSERQRAILRFFVEKRLALAVEREKGKLTSS